jgi:hypothetical protein
MLSYMKENTEKGYKDTNICILSDSQAAIKVLHNFQIYSQTSLDLPSFHVKTGRM